MVRSETPSALSRAEAMALVLEAEKLGLTGSRLKAFIEAMPSMASVPRRAPSHESAGWSGAGRSKKRLNGWGL